MTNSPERHKDTARNIILNRCVSDLDDIINNHDPEIHVPIDDGVWDRLDKLAVDIAAAAVLAEREACATLMETLFDDRPGAIAGKHIRARTTQEGE